MGWAYYTADLPSGRQITFDQRNELYAAFAERVNALPAGSGFTYDATANAAILASRVISDAVSLNGTIQKLASAIGALASASVFTDAGTPPAPVTSPFPPGFASTSIFEAEYWNGCRTAILAFISIPWFINGGSATSFLKNDASLHGPFPNFPLAAADFVAAPYVGSGSTAVTTFVSSINSVASFRFTHGWQISGMAPAAPAIGADFRVFQLGTLANNTIPANVIFTMGGGTSTDLVDTSGVATEIPPVTGSTGGAWTWGIDTSNLSPWSALASNVASTDLDSFYAVPNWTYT